MGKTLLPDLLQVPHPLPELPALDMKLRRISKRILEGTPINNKSFRKTWESWLLLSGQGTADCTEPGPYHNNAV